MRFSAGFVVGCVVGAAVAVGVVAVLDAMRRVDETAREIGLADVGLPAAAWGHPSMWGRGLRLVGENDGN